ncbi:MAG: hybrid sensor histidine kinase/response regulator [Deltaproteobacteria bacterium]|nr:hybrid sensor histidine kinase/response regulator [Deltaproteobacteria bacterium]MBN2671495.1 hybrid sensor histidine kinase/response regulator [Deltaproteobacteria bacterium]
MTSSTMAKKTEVTVLHIEHDADNRRLVREILTNNGVQVIEASTGIDGIRKALSVSPDVILLDIELPDLDGYEVTLKIRGDARARDIPIIALSTQADSRMVQAVGCDGLIIKPIEISKITNQVNAFAQAGRPTVNIRSLAERDDDSGLLLLQGHKLADKLQHKLEELQRANRALLESEKIRTDFYRNLSHELSTPLTPAVGYLNMLLNEDLGELTPLQRKAIESIGRGVNKVRAMVENLLDVTALSTGKMSFFSREYDFNTQAREAIKLCAEQFRERGIHVDSSIPKSEFAGVGDSEKLRRAMVQLLENAIKFCKPEGQVHVCTRRTADRFMYLVYDSGTGIPEQELQAIFKTFYQIDGSPTREHGGTGLGLALARKIIERFGGKIWAESPPKEHAVGFEWAQTMVGLWVPAKVKPDAD